MTLPAGLELGGLQIVRLVGAGGMGEVYLAHDPQLNRRVAVKVLRPEIGREPHRLARLEHEARAASALSHPSICHVYHLGETADGQRYIAMEFVEGERLDQRLDATRLPLRDALDIAVQIAAALTAAHAAGIVHRDIKPENVMIRPDRLVKVLDFGLAKLAPPPVPFEPHGPTQALVTDAGSLVGTTAYMSPEQARGHAVDARSDVWALGVVIYEMVAGRLPFTGSSRSDLLVAILDRDPTPLGRINARVPAELQRIVTKCLRKDPEQRYQGAKDLMLDLETLRDELTSDTAAAKPLARADLPQSRSLTARRLAAVIAIGAIGLLGGWWAMQQRPTSNGVYTLDLLLDGFELTVDTWPVLSPNGRFIVYLAEGQLWRRALDEFTSTPIPDSSGAGYPFWSPDSSQIAFVKDRKLWTISLDAANAIPVADAPEGLSGTGSGAWTPSGDLIMAGRDAVGLLSIRISDGQRREILPIDKKNEIDFHQVAALPDGRGLLLAVHRSQGSDTIAALVNGRRHDVLQLPGETIQAPVYSPPGYLLFERRTTSNGIWAIRFSLDRLATDGAPFLLVPGGVAPSIGQDGTLAFVRDWLQKAELVWIDRKGSIEPVGNLNGQVGQAGPAFALAPDERQLVLSLDVGTGNELWSYDLVRRSMTRLSTGATRVTSPIWTPDQRHVLLGAFGRGRNWNLYSVPANEAREPERLLPGSDLRRWPCSVSPDGRWLVYAVENTNGSADLWLAPRDDLSAAQPLMETPFREDYAKFAPDGRSILYVSDETGKPEVYVRPFPIGAERVQVSTHGGSMAVWSPNGHEIFYRTPTTLMAVSVASSPRGVTVSPPQQLFTIAESSGLHESFAATSDGRFLFARAMTRASVGVMLNWTSRVNASRHTP